MLFIVELSVIFFSTLIFSTLNTTLNSTLDTLFWPLNNFFVQEGNLTKKIKLLVGISATMCHSAEKIPAKEECQYKRVRT